MNSEWQEASLGSLAKVELGKMLDKKKNQGEYRNYIGNDNVQWGYFKLDDIKKMRIKDSELERFRVEPGDLMVCEGGNPGRCALWASDAEMYYQKALNRVRVGENLIPSFLLYYMIHLGRTHEIRQYFTGGATIKHLPNAALKRVVIRYPAIDVQKKISATLASYDKLIENNRKQIALLEEAAQRLYKEWFVDMRFPGAADSEIINGIPQGWHEEKLSDIANVVMGQSPKSEYYNDKGEGLPFHQGVSNFGLRFVTDKIYSTSSTRIGKAGSILFSVRAPVGRLNYTKKDIVLGRGLAAMNHRQGLQSYLYYLLKERFFKDDIIGNGSIFASISKGELLAQKFVVPTIEIAARFNSLCAPIDEQIEKCDDMLKAAQEARDRLLPKLMSGEIEV